MNYVHLGFKSRVPCAKLFRSVPGEDLTALDDSLEQVQNSRGIGPVLVLCPSQPNHPMVDPRHFRAPWGRYRLLGPALPERMMCNANNRKDWKNMCIPSLHLDFISPCSRGVLKIREVTYHLFAFFTLYTSDHPLNPLSKTARSKDQCWRENKTSKHVLPMKHLQEERKWMMLEKVFGPPARVCLRSYAVLQFNVCDMWPWPKSRATWLNLQSRWFWAIWGCRHHENHKSWSVSLCWHPEADCRTSNTSPIGKTQYIYIYIYSIMQDCAEQNMMLHPWQDFPRVDWQTSRYSLCASKA